MKISKKWLSQYMDLSDMSIEEIADKITSAGLEVEGIEKMSQGSNLVIGKVISCEDHPDSDHLHVCQVDLGDKIEHRMRCAKCGSWTKGNCGSCRSEASGW